MRLYHLIVLTALFGLLSAWAAADGFAMDQSGCLTCHQYPGLTRPEGPTGFKVFHIDEKRYLQSPHGKIDCRQCHTMIHKVPHVGETAVTCNNGCHSSAKDKKMIADYDLKTLHANEKSYITRLADGSSCRECHRLYPHESNELARAFINMHIGFMTCDTCHINREKYQHLEYDWTGSETADFAGEPFGSRFNPKMEGGPPSAHFISRIAVFAVKDGKKRPMLNTWDTAAAKAFLAEEKQLSPEEKQKRLDYFHKDIHKAEISVTCNECHSKDTILNFTELGFSDKKAHDLININIKGLVTKYKVFYFPDIFRQ